MAPHSSTLAWKIPWMEEPGGLQSMGSWRVVDMTEQLHFHFSLSCTGEGNGNPLQCSCLENPRDGGAWWAAIYGVAQNWTRLKRLSSSSSSSSSICLEVLLNIIKQQRKKTPKYNKQAQQLAYRFNLLSYKEILVSICWYMFLRRGYGKYICKSKEHKIMQSLIKY